MIESPQSFAVRTECVKAASQNGYRKERAYDGGWAGFGSTTAKGSIWLAAGSYSGPWYLALDHDGVAAELGRSPLDIPGPGRARFVFATLAELYAVLPRVYALGVSLPDGPLDTYRQAVQGLPCTTEAERLVVQRVGQDIFRDGLMRYWESRCPLTGIAEPALLRASHIKPWAKCDSDAERLDVHNGLLLSALWDAAFDCGQVTFDDEGTPRLSPSLGPAAREALRWSRPIPLTVRHREKLAWHRTNLFNKIDPASARTLVASRVDDP